MSDWREIMGASAIPPTAFANPTHNPQNQPIKPRSADIAYENQTGSSPPTAAAEASEHVIEATFRSTADEAARPASALVDHQFPPCPECGASRYWISRGKVMCGSRTCYSAVRFILTSVEYHPIN